jgi:hypothetical protein
MVRGKICVINGCGANGTYIAPYWSGTTGYSILKVDDGRMQEGVWYVSGAAYDFKSASAINKGMTASSTNMRTVSDPVDIAECVLRGQTSLTVNYYQFNAGCKGKTAEVEARIQNTLDHEEAHHNAAIALAPVQDPQKKIERLFDNNPTELKDAVFNTMNGVHNALVVELQRQQPSTAVSVYLWSSVALRHIIASW